MKKKIYRLWIAVIVIAGLTINIAASAQLNNTWTKKEAKKWYYQYQWQNGLQLKPENTIDKLEFAKQYHAHKTWWDKAFAFMKEPNNAELKPGIYPIDGENVFAKITEIPSKTFEDPKWENHQNYADIQYVISGQEQIGIGSLSKSTMIVPYNKQKDITFYNGKGKYYIAKPGTFFIFFTHQTHRPSIKVAGYEVVKKIVIKVRCL